MLVLSRKKHEQIFVGDIVITVAEVRGDRVRLGIEAPQSVPIIRGEIKDGFVPKDAGDAQGEGEPVGVGADLKE